MKITTTSREFMYRKITNVGEEKTRYDETVYTDLSWNLEITFSWVYFFNVIFVLDYTSFA